MRIFDGPGMSIVKRPWALVATTLVPLCQPGIVQLSVIGASAIGCLPMVRCPNTSPVCRHRRCRSRPWALAGRSPQRRTRRLWIVTFLPCRTRLRSVAVQHRCLLTAQDSRRRGVGGVGAAACAPPMAVSAATAESSAATVAVRVRTWGWQRERWDIGRRSVRAGPGRAAASPGRAGRRARGRTAAIAGAGRPIRRFGPGACCRRWCCGRRR